jgi:pimeloyl-ACP methyl ester carboxylesterase
MLKTTKFQNAKLRYFDKGSGSAIVLLHGYLESLETWNPIIVELSTKHRVISIDIPGHGESGIVAAYHTMDNMAEAVITVLDELEIDRAFVVGHSMGGYIAMALASNYSERLTGFSLLHSTPFADSDEKKANRDREIELVRNGKKELIVNTNIPKAFANDNLKLFSDQVERAKTIGRLSPVEGIIALLNGMKERPDRSFILQHSKLPFIWFLGKKDNYIVYSAIEEQFGLLPVNGKIVALENSGHMGFLEEAEIFVSELLGFIE